MSRLPKLLQPAKRLSQVLKNSELVSDMVQESANELVSVNQLLNAELSDRAYMPGVDSALEKSAAVELKVQEASEQLSKVNVGLQQEVQERHLLEQALVKVTDQQQETLHASLHDALTGLPNRLLFNDRLEHGLAQAKRHSWTLAVMFLDLDGFKTINDTYGHDAGDAVLRTIAKRLKETTRTDDTISRHGGDEFMYLLMDICEDQDAALVAQKILSAIRVPCAVGADALTVGASIGIAVFPRDGMTAAALVSCADAAMYQAKQSQSGFAFASENPARRSTDL